ncbi:MAG: DUF1285 domain-containing protein [Deltaproteobacteria bacterium]|nr:DUF1285 domain-containing protein [Deltaproteobacteria bacterium]
MPENDIPPCLIHIDKEGKWFHEGSEMIHREFIRLFYQHMELDSLDRYIINYRGERCYVEVEDTAFIVTRVELKDHADNSRFVLYLSDDSQEGLLPDTLYVGKDNVLYCRVKDRGFPARFSRAAYYQLAEYLEEEDGDYYLSMNGEKHLISA